MFARVESFRQEREFHHQEKPEKNGSKPVDPELVNQIYEAANYVLRRVSNCLKHRRS